MNTFIAFAQDTSVYSTPPSKLWFLLPILMMAFAIFVLVFWIRMIIHAASHDVENKTVWIIVLVVFGFLAAIAYYFVIKRNFVAVSPASVQPPMPTSIPMPQSPDSLNQDIK